MITELATTMDSGGLGIPWLPGMILVQLEIGFLILLVWSARRLPARLTTQFGITGQPGSQMTRKVYLIFIGVFGLWASSWGLLFYILSKYKPAGLHIPHKDYWLAPERVAMRG